MGILRVLLALSVLAGHSSPFFGTSFVGGLIAVESFFMISGFYMALILEKKYAKTKHPYALYITNRFLRIFPVYWTILVLTILISLYWHTMGIGGRLDPYFQYRSQLNIGVLLYFIFSNIFLFGQDIIFFLGLNTHTGLLFFTKDYTQTSVWTSQFLIVFQAWALGIELVFYLLAPFIVKRSNRILWLLILLGIGIKLGVYFLGLTKDPWIYRFFPAEIVFFLLGVASHRIYNWLRKKGVTKHNNMLLVWLLFVIGTVLFSFIPGINVTGVSIYRVLYYSILFFSLPIFFLYFKDNPLDTFIGNLSYPLYISHYLVILFLLQYVTGIQGKTYFGILAAVLTFLFSIGLYLCIDRPINMLREKRVQQERVS